MILDVFYIGMFYLQISMFHATLFIENRQYQADFEREKKIYIKVVTFSGLAPLVVVERTELKRDRERRD